MPATPSAGKRAVEHSSAPHDDSKWSAASSHPVIADRPLGGEETPAISSGPVGKGLHTQKDVVSVIPPHYTKDTTHQHVEIHIPELDTKKDLLIVGDSTGGPPELGVIPVVVTATPGETIKVWTQCLSMPWFLPGGREGRRSPK